MREMKRPYKTRKDDAFPEISRKYVHWGRGSIQRYTPRFLNYSGTCSEILGRLRTSPLEIFRYGRALFENQTLPG